MLNRIEKGSNAYVVYEFKSEDVIVDEISVIMINNNQDNSIGLAPIRMESINGINKKMLFDITGKVSLREFVNKRINQNSFKNMMLNLIDSIENFDEYMIDVHQILLDIDNVYINELDLKVSFICLAVKNLEQSGNLRLFFKNVIENSNVTIAMNEKDYFHCVWNVIRNESGFSLSNMKTALTTGVSVAVQNNLKKSEVVQQSVPNTNKAATQPSIVNSTNVPVHSFSVDNTVTVNPTPQPAVQAPIQPPVVTQENKKKPGLLGKLFGSKKAEAAPKSNTPKNTVARGGIASLKNGGYKSNIPTEQPATQASDSNSTIPQMNVSQIGNVVPQNSNNMVNQPSMNGNMPNNYNSGTTVLNSMPTNLNSGTTVLNSMPNNATTGVNNGNSVNSGTTVLNSMPVSTTTVGVNQNNSMNNGTAGVNSAVGTINKPEISKQNEEISAYNSVAQSQAAPQKLSLSKASSTENSNATADKGTTVLVQNPGETTVLSGNMQSRFTPYLVRYKNNEKILINGSEFQIGKERSQVDYFIGDNTAISRTHAKIVVKNNEYFLIDTNSTNHTYINGVMLQPNSEVRIVNGDVIKLANENFDFKLL